MPWRVDDHELFFGPCKKALRRSLRDEFLGPARTWADVARQERLIVAGVNAGHGSAPRKVVYAGEVQAVMSFAEASARLAGPRYGAMRGARLSPLHVAPILDGGDVVGYERVSEEHAEESTEHPGEFGWWDDLVPRPMRARRIGSGTSSALRLKRGVPWWDGFPLDACFTLTNRFWANGAGLPLDADAIRLLRLAQHEATQVDASAPFGRDARGSAIGKRGSYLEAKGRHAEELAAWLDRCAPSAPGGNPPAKTRSRSPRRC